MIISTDEQLGKLKEIGSICAQVLEQMSKAVRPGMTTAELDDLGRILLERMGAQSAPQLAYDFPGATCISVNEEIAHGIPGDRLIQAGDLINIDVSAAKDGVFADMGASMVVPPVTDALARLCRDGRRAMWAGIKEGVSGAPLANVGQAIGKFAKKNGYSLITNLASHGVGDSLHDEPGEIATWPDRSERRKIADGLVFTVEPFLSLGGRQAVESPKDDGWTLICHPPAPCVQYEHTIVATKRGAVVVTVP